MMKIGREKCRSEAFGLILNTVFGINSPVIRMISVDRMVCTKRVSALSFGRNGIRLVRRIAIPIP